MNYIQLTIFVSTEQQEILIAQLSELGAIGFEQEDQKMLCYFNVDGSEMNAVNQLVAEHPHEQILIPETNWNAVWESNFEPVVVDRFCAIRADFHHAVPGVRFDIIITPKMSFGTGHHATTYMMIQQMRELDFTNRSVFDFGTGTGILSILAKKLGANSVIAIDVDEWSIRNADENFQRNGVSGIRLYESTLLPAESFDFILANINKNVLLEYAAGLAKITSEGGMLLLSGILAEDDEAICSVFTKEGFQFIKRLQSGNWLSILFQQ